MHEPVRALEMAVAAAVARSHGIDSGARLPADTINVDVSPQDTPRTRCLKHLLVSTRHDIAGDRASALSELRTAQQTALGAADTLADLDLLGNLANAALHLGDDDAHRRFYALMLSTARENGDGMAVLYALQRVPFSQYVGGQWAALTELRGGGRHTRSQRRAARGDGRPAGVADTARRTRGSPRLRRTPHLPGGPGGRTPARGHPGPAGRRPDPVGQGQPGHCSRVTHTAPCTSSARWQRPRRRCSCPP